MIEELRLTVTRVSRILGVRRASLSGLLNGTTAVTAKTALRIEKVFGLNMEMLLRMHAWHDARRMRAHADDVAVQRYEPVRKTAG